MKRAMIDANQLELTEKVVTIKRVSKTVKGGRNMRFTALVVVGDNNGHVGVGLGKATEIPEAIRKGKEDAAKNIVSVALDENASISHDYLGEYGSAQVLLKKSPDGTGIIAGGPARMVCELAGIKNIRTKSLGSNNKQNVVLATLSGLSQLKVPEVMISLMYLMYRYIFVLLETYQGMKVAAESRMGYAHYWKSIRTTGLVYRNLLVKSYEHAMHNFDAMESRCFDGQVKFLSKEKAKRKSKNGRCKCEFK